MRDLIKTLTFASLHFSVGFGVTYALTGSVSIATGVALIEPAINTVVFYFHEKAWQRAKPAAAPLDGCRHGHRALFHVFDRTEEVSEPWEAAPVTAKPYPRAEGQY